MITAIIIICSTVVFVVGLVLGFFAWKTFLDNEAYGVSRLVPRVNVCEKEIRELRKQLDKRSIDNYDLGETK